VPVSYSPAVIDFTNVSLARGGKPVLRSLTFSVAQGETVVLVGRSGAGKSSILKLINRMLVPDAGSVAVNGVVTTNTDGVAGKPAVWRLASTNCSRWSACLLPNSATGCQARSQEGNGSGSEWPGRSPQTQQSC
jgi:energy-coupling factor transporter ATP-binding protein EcfA2